jgi:uncharacterized protein YbjT (DUF2867 family)
VNPDFTQERSTEMKVSIIGASGKLGQYKVQHALDKGYEVVGVCRAESVAELIASVDASPSFRGATHDGG